MAANQLDLPASLGPITAITGDHADTKIAAVAYVRGTATRETADAWHRAREQLRQRLISDGLEPLEALPGEGWDFTTGDDEITFWSAALPDHPQRRRGEKHTASNVGSRYVVVSSAQDQNRSTPR